MKIGNCGFCHRQFPMDEMTKVRKHGENKKFACCVDCRIKNIQILEVE